VQAGTNRLSQSSYFISSSVQAGTRAKRLRIKRFGTTIMAAYALAELPSMVLQGND